MRRSLRHFLYIVFALFHVIVLVPRAYPNIPGKGEDNHVPTHLPVQSRGTGNGPPVFGRNDQLTDTTPGIAHFDYFVSNKGSNDHDGKSATSPKLYVDSIENQLRRLAVSQRYAAMGLDASSIFREQFDVGASNISVNSYNLTDRRRFAKLTGMDIIKDWNTSVAGPNVYEHLLPHSVKLDQPDYNYILVAEIDTILEKTSPVAAVTYLRLASDLSTCAKVAGTYFVAPLKTNPVLVSIHPTEGIPGKTKYRYEVTTRHQSVSGYAVNGGRYEHLFLQSSGYGYGMLSGGKNTLVRNVVFQGGGTHHLVIKSGTIDSCLFFPGPAGLKDRVAAVFYESQGGGNVNKVVNSIFVDIPFPILTHTSGTSSHQKLTIDKVYAFADTTDAHRAFSALNSDSVVITNSYAEGYPTGWYGGDSRLFISNTIFRNTNQSAISIYKNPGKEADAVISNVLIKTDANDRNQSGENKSAFGIRASYPNSNVEASNMIFHGYSTWNLIDAPVIKTFSIGGIVKARHNIYICDVNEKNYLHLHKASNNAGTGTSDNVVSDSNVFILVRGKGFHWYVDPFNNGGNTVVTLQRWQSLTGQDSHSILIDLRSNPLGLKAIFVDPANGNWTFRDSRYLASIRKLNAGMITPPMYYPSRPSVIYRSPFDMPGGFSSFEGEIDTAKRSVLEWQTFNESQVEAFVVEFSTDGINYTPVDTVLAKGGGTNNSYLYTQEQPEVKRYYRLRLINADKTTQLSSVILLEANPEFKEFKMIVFPNPVSSRVTILHPKADPATISLYDFMGHLLKSFTVQPLASETSLQMDDLTQGTYLLKWSGGGKQLVSKIIKVK